MGRSFFFTMAGKKLHILRKEYIFSIFSTLGRIIACFDAFFLVGKHVHDLFT